MRDEGGRPDGCRGRGLVALKETFEGLRMLKNMEWSPNMAQNSLQFGLVETTQGTVLFMLPGH